MHPMFRRERRRTVGCAVVLASSLPLFLVWVAWGGLRPLVGSVLVATVIFGLFVQTMAARAIPRSLVLVADRPVRSAARIRGRLLARSLESLEAIAPCVELRFRAGIARHDPAVLRAIVAGLQPSIVEPDLRESLDALSVALEAAEQEGARCCLMSTEHWSGAIETNLGLFFVTC